MEEKPVVGQRVRLNDHGKYAIGGLTSDQMIRAAADMTVTGVFDVGLSDTWDIEVDEECINVFMISNHDIDPL